MIHGDPWDTKACFTCYVPGPFFSFINSLPLKGPQKLAAACMLRLDLGVERINTPQLIFCQRAPVFDNLSLRSNIQRTAEMFYDGFDNQSPGELYNAKESIEIIGYCWIRHSKVPKYVAAWMDPCVDHLWVPEKKRIRRGDIHQLHAFDFCCNDILKSVDKFWE